VLAGLQAGLITSWLSPLLTGVEGWLRFAPSKAHDSRWRWLIFVALIFSSASMLACEEPASPREDHICTAARLNSPADYR